MDGAWKPSLQLSEHAGRYRLTLVGLTSGHGATLQDAGTDLVQRVEKVASSLRRSGFRFPAELGPPDLRLLNFVHEVAELSARGRDVRDLVLGA